MARGYPMSKIRFAISIPDSRAMRPFVRLELLAVIALALGASPARADRCDDLAKQLKGQIDSLGVGKTAANLIYLSHPLAKQFTLGCAGRSYSNQLFVK